MTYCYEKYGVVLQRLSLSTLEQLRNWRNDPKISQYMEYREYITPDMQLKWFNSINNNKNYYFMVQFNHMNIGMTNIKNIDYANKCGESGIFIYDDKYLNSDVAFRISCALNDFAFEVLGLAYTYGHILKNNKRAIRFNRFMGCQLQENQSMLNNQCYHLTKEHYFQRRTEILNMLDNITQ